MGFNGILGVSNPFSAIDVDLTYQFTSQLHGTQNPQIAAALSVSEDGEVDWTFGDAYDDYQGAEETFTLPINGIPFNQINLFVIIVRGGPDETLRWKQYRWKLQPACPGLYNGAATPISPGACLPLSYVWQSGGAAGAAAGSDLPDGSYQVTVTDGRGRELSAQVVIPEAPFALDITVQPVACGQTVGGSASVSIAGGHAPLSYLWSTGAQTPGISGLTPGVYTLTLSDSRGRQTVLSLTVADQSVSAPVPGAPPALALIPNPAALHVDLTDALNIKRQSLPNP